MSEEITTIQANEVPADVLVRYSSLDLVEVRKNPRKFPRVVDTPTSTAVRQMTKYVYAALLYKGQSMAAEAVAFTAKALVEEIANDNHYGLRSISWAEVGRAIRLAVLGGDGGMYGVSVSSLYQSLINYAKGEGHEAARKAF